MTDLTNSKHYIIITLTILSLFILIYTFKSDNNATPSSETDNNALRPNKRTNKTSAAKRGYKHKLKSRSNNELSCDYNTYLFVNLDIMIKEYTFSNSHCLPSERKHYTDLCAVQKHDAKNSRWRGDDDARGVGVVWCVVGLLVISVIASFVDACNAKVADIKKTRSMLDVAGKPGAVAIRRCSLATTAASRNPRRQLFSSRRPASIAEGPPLRASSTTSSSIQQTPPTGTSNASVRVKFD